MEYLKSTGSKQKRQRMIYGSDPYSANQASVKNRTSHSLRSNLFTVGS
jgi:hypothetical protein